MTRCVAGIMGQADPHALMSLLLRACRHVVRIAPWMQGLFGVGGHRFRCGSSDARGGAERQWPYGSCRSPDTS